MSVGECLACLTESLGQEGFEKETGDMGIDRREMRRGSGIATKARILACTTTGVYK